MREGRIQPRWIALLAATAAGLYLCWLMLLPFINVLAWAAVLVVVFYPVHRRLVERTKRPATSALISCLLVIFVILLPLTLVTLALASYSPLICFSCGCTDDRRFGALWGAVQLASLLDLAPLMNWFMLVRSSSRAPRPPPVARAIIPADSMQ